MMHRSVLSTILVALSVASVLSLTACRQDEVAPAEQAATPTITPTEAALEPAASETPTTIDENETAGEDKTAQPVQPPPAARLITKAEMDVQLAQAELLAKWNAIERISVSYESTFDRKSDMNQRGATRSTYDILKRDGKELVHQELINRMVIDREEDQALTGFNKTFIYDGEFVYVLQSLHDKQLAYKRNYDPSRMQQVGGIALFRQIRAFDTVKCKPPQAVKDRQAYVFVVASKDKSVTGEYLVDTETGALLGLELSNTATENELKAWVTDIKMNPEFPQDHFTLAIPEGVQLQDETVSPSSP